MSNVIPLFGTRHLRILNRHHNFEIGQLVMALDELAWHHGETVKPGHVVVIRRFIEWYCIGRQEHGWSIEVSRPGEDEVAGVAEFDQVRICEAF